MCSGILGVGIVIGCLLGNPLCCSYSRGPTHGISLLGFFSGLAGPPALSTHCRPGSKDNKLRRKRAPDVPSPERAAAATGFRSIVVLGVPIVRCVQTLDCGGKSNGFEAHSWCSAEMAGRTGC